MVRIALSPEVAARLHAFLQSPIHAERTDHWHRYGKLNRIRVEENYAVVNAGAGFDSEYELNFRRPTFRERAGTLFRKLTGRGDISRYGAAYVTLWNQALPLVVSPHQIIALHYYRFIADIHSKRYLEIGAGSGYLAGLVYEHSKARITIIDLPEILPFSFLYLHSQFPEVSFALPGESKAATFTFLTDGDVIAENSMDLAVNTASFGEMRADVVEQYFHLLRRVLMPGGCFFTVNREEKSMDGRPIRFENYPWSEDDEDLYFGVSNLHALTQPENRMMVRLCRLAKEGQTRNSASE